MRRLFLDANVLFTAAHNPNGKAAFIISLGSEGKWEIFTSTFAAEEARRNLSAKFPSAEKKLNEILESITIILEQPDAPYPYDLNEKDRPIFQAAHACSATDLITGDLAHFGTFMNKKEQALGITIQTASSFLNSL